VPELTGLVPELGLHPVDILSEVGVQGGGLVRTCRAVIVFMRCADNNRAVTEVVFTAARSIGAAPTPGTLERSRTTINTDVDNIGTLERSVIAHPLFRVPNHPLAL
jgi:hypothetical protein